MKPTLAAEKTLNTTESTVRESQKTYLLPTPSAFIENQSLLIALLKKKINQLSQTILTMEEQLSNYETTFKQLGKTLAIKQEDPREHDNIIWLNKIIKKLPEMMERNTVVVEKIIEVAQPIAVQKIIEVQKMVEIPIYVEKQVPVYIEKEIPVYIEKEVEVECQRCRKQKFSS